MQVLEVLLRRTGLNAIWGRGGRGSLRERLASGVFWNLTGAVASRGMMFAANVCVARMLTKEAYGEYGIVHSTVVMSGMLAGLGMSSTGKKVIAEYRERDPDKVGRIIALATVLSLGGGLLLAALLAGFAPFVATRLLGGSDSLVGPLRVSGAVLLLNTLIGVQNGVVTGFEAFRQDAARAVLAMLFTGPAIVAGVWLFGVTGAFLGFLVGALVNVVLYAGVVRHHLAAGGIRIDFRGAFRELPIFWRVSLPMTVSSLLTSPVTWICNVILVNAVNGYAEMGTIEATNNGRTLVMFVPGQIAQVFLPILSNLASKQEHASHRKTASLSIAASVGSALIVAAPLILVPEFVMGLFGAEFRGAGTVLVIMALAMVARAGCDAMQVVYYSLDRVWGAAGLSTVWAVINLTMTWWFIRTLALGALGYVLALLFSTCLRALMQWVYLRRATLGRGCGGPNA